MRNKVAASIFTETIRMFPANSVEFYLKDVPTDVESKIKICRAVFGKMPHSRLIQQCAERFLFAAKMALSAKLV